MTMPTKTANSPQRWTRISSFRMFWSVFRPTKQHEQAESDETGIEGLAQSPRHQIVRGLIGGCEMFRP